MKRRLTPGQAALLTDCAILCATLALTEPRVNPKQMRLAASILHRIKPIMDDAARRRKGAKHG